MTLSPTARAPTAFGPVLRRLEARRLALFLCVGLAGLATDAGTFTALAAGGLGYPAARALSIGVATALTWQLNRRFTFARSGRRAVAELGRYALVTLAAQGTSYATFLALVRLVPALPALAALLAGAILATFLSFTGQRFFTFRAAA